MYEENLTVTRRTRIETYKDEFEVRYRDVTCPFIAGGTTRSVYRLTSDTVVKFQRSWCSHLPINFREWVVWCAATDEERQLLARVYEHGIIDGIPFLVQEFIEFPNDHNESTYRNDIMPMLENHAFIKKWVHHDLWWKNACWPQGRKTPVIIDFPFEEK